MRLKFLGALGIAALAIAIAIATAWAPAATPVAAASNGPELSSIGPLTFAPDGTLFAADTQAATIYALELGATTGPSGAKGIDAIDQQIAAMLGTDVKGITVTDLAVHPKTRNAYIAVMRGQGAEAKPALVRVDGDGKVSLVSLTGVKHSKVALPNAPAVGTDPRRNARTQSITDMAFKDGKLYIAGLSNEEFASKLRAIAYPFAAVENGTSVEIFHGNHGQLETRSPVWAFVPYNIQNQPHLIAGYLCTPLVKFPLASLASGTKVVGTTIAELGNRNRPIDMIVYQKDGQDFILMANNSRGVMKIPTRDFATAQPITSRVESETGGVAYETVASMRGIEQLDKFDDRTTIVLARVDGSLHLQTVPLP
jgi:hypothetical protein